MPNGSRERSVDDAAFHRGASAHLRVVANGCNRAPRPLLTRSQAAIRLPALVVVWTVLPLVLVSAPLYGQVDPAGSFSAEPRAEPGSHLQQQQQPNQSPQPYPSQNPSSQETNSGSQLATVVGTVTDVNGNAVGGASIVLQGVAPGDRRTVAASDNGFFEIPAVKPGVPYHVTVSAKGFAEWTSAPLILTPGQYEIVPGIKLQIQELRTTVVVSPHTSEEIATEEVKIEETQRGFGVIPNFLEVFQPNPQPLTWKLKFGLAFKVARDPVTITGAGLLATANEIAGTPRYADGMLGFAERFGASYANQLTDTMIGDAILPSLLHQDPRYFYQGVGTKKSRVLHALSKVLVTRGDNGRVEPNYSLLGGDLASAAIATAYYPSANRGAALVFRNFALNVGVHAAGGLLEEFVFHPSHPLSPQPQGP
jgi:hypothetical protein